jgi:hypothetical protein
MLKAALLFLAALCSLTCNAAPSIQGTATLKFSITIPAFIFLRVGSGGAPVYGTNSTINKLTFNVPVAQIGSGTPIAPTGGDLNGGTTVTAQAHSTVGSIQVTSNVSSTSGLSSAQGNTIPWSQIGVTFSAAAGPLGNTNFPTSTTVQNGWSITFKNTDWADGTWTFSYKNQSVVPPGTYSGRVTYTALAL